MEEYILENSSGICSDEKNKKWTKHPMAYRRNPALVEDKGNCASQVRSISINLPARKVQEPSRSSQTYLLKNSRKQYFDSLEKTLYSNPKCFWKLFKLNSKSRNIPQFVSWTTVNDHKIANSTKSIAELFNGYFASVFTDHLHNREMTDTDPADLGEAPPQNLDELNISELEVVAVLEGLNPEKALGPDGIPDRILKEETAQHIAPTLTLLFNKSLHSAVLPD
ncbi:Hypothetical predicted protein, partial [Paramuricea clavata]